MNALQRSIDLLRRRMLSRSREGRCLICGCPLESSAINICPSCAPPDSAGVVELVSSLGLLIQCPVCGQRVPHLQLHYYLRAGDGEHPQPRGPVPSTARWVLETLFQDDGGRERWSGGDAP